MKKIALLSFTKSYNYGAALQAYALWHVIANSMEQDVECKYIDYKRNYKSELFIWLLRKIYRGILGLDDYPSYTIRNLIKETVAVSKDNFFSDELKEKFEQFWNLTPYTNKVTKKELKSLSDDFDIFIVGSDQVWNPGKVNLDKSYLLDFVNESKRRYSYASSLGMKKIPEKYKEKYRYYLNLFDAISVREKSGADIINTILENGKKAEHHCDPTLLIDKYMWNSITLDDSINRNGYVLLYDLTRNDEMCARMASVIAKRYGTDICVVSQEKDFGPKQWVQLFLNAQFIVTNSFHGTAFSINFSKNFICLVPGKDSFENSVERITGLLSEFGLEDRVVREKKLEGLNDEAIVELLDAMNHIDYEKIQKDLAKLRAEGIDYLRKCLE